MDYTIPSELRYTADDEWVQANGDATRIGVTDFAQEQLGDIVYVELPKAGDTISSGDPFGVIESVKAVSDLIAPVSGEVTAVNDLLAETPELVNEDCYGRGWMIEVRLGNASDMDSLDDAVAYAASVAERSD